MSEGDVTAHPGHLKLGTGSTAGWIVTPAFPVASGKSAIVNVTLNAMKYEKDAQSDYAIAVLSSSEVGTGSGNRESSFTWPDTSDESLYGYNLEYSYPLSKARVSLWNHKTDETCLIAYSNNNGAVSVSFHDISSKEDLLKEMHDAIEESRKFGNVTISKMD